MSTWQLWLSPRPAQRTHTANQAVIEAPHGSIRYEFLKLEKDGELVDAVQETHSIAHEHVRQGRSGPPLHIHLHQSEHFQVLSGTLGLVLNDQQLALTKEGGTVSIPPGARHTFWVHASTEEDVTMRVWVKPQGIKNGLDEGFLRNFAGYLSDCEREGLQPSLFQLYRTHAAFLDAERGAPRPASRPRNLHWSICLESIMVAQGRTNDGMTLFDLGSRPTWSP